MAYEQRELSGSLFKNEKRETDKHPNMQGSALINGVEYWVSAWTKEGAKGKWQSLAFKPKERDEKPAPEPRRGRRDEDDSDVPFVSCSLSDDPIFKRLRWDKE